MVNLLFGFRKVVLYFFGVILYVVIWMELIIFGNFLKNIYCLLIWVILLILEVCSLIMVFWVIWEDGFFVDEKFFISCFIVVKGLGK